MMRTGKSHAGSVNLTKYVKLDGAALGRLLSV
jgi:hypothetical protein